MNKIFFLILIMSFFNTLCSADQTTQGEKVQSCEKNDSIRINFNWDVDFTIKKSDIKKIGISLFTLYLIYHLIELKRIFSSCFTLKDDDEKIKYRFSGYPIALEWFARYAIFTENNTLLEKMLKWGACANFRDNASMTLLEYALHLKNKDAYTLLINYGALVSYAFEPRRQPYFPEGYYFCIEEKNKLETMGETKNIFMTVYTFFYNLNEVCIDTFCVFLWPLSHYFRKIRLANPPEGIDNYSTYYNLDILFIINNNLPSSDLADWLQNSEDIEEKIREKLKNSDPDNFAEPYNKIVHSIIGCQQNEKTSKYFDIVYERVKNYHENLLKNKAKF